MSSYYLAASHDNMSCVSDSTANVDVRPTAAMKTCSEEPQGQVGETFPFQAYGDELHRTTQASGDLEDEEQSSQTPFLLILNKISQLRWLLVNRMCPLMEDTCV